MKALIANLMVCFLFFSLSAMAQKGTYDFNETKWNATNTTFPKAFFPSMTQNDVVFSSTMIYQKAGKGVKQAVLSKKTQNSSIVFPKFKKAKAVVVSCSATGINQPVLLEEMLDGSWVPVGDPIMVSKTKSEVKKQLSKKATQIRLSNQSGAYVYITKVRIE